MKEETLFKVGQTVWCAMYGKGIIQCDDMPEPYSVLVEMDNGMFERYTADGRLFTLSNRTLFFSEPKIDALTEPEFIPTLIGKVVDLVEAGKDGGSYYRKVKEEFKDLLVVYDDGERGMVTINKDDWHIDVIGDA